MPEPTIEDLNHWLAPDYVPDEAQVEQLRARLNELKQVRELFGMDGWAVLVRYLERNVAQDRAELETCKVEAIGAVRARLAWWRWFIDLPEKTRIEETTLRAELEGLQPTEEDA